MISKLFPQVEEIYIVGVKVYRDNVINLELGKYGLTTLMVSIGNLQLLENLNLKDNNLNSRTETSFERREETLED